MPKDKVNYRARGPRTVLTRQTVQGRANDGGLRIGEMDRDCLIAHGMSSFIKESMMVRGDQYEMAICNKTGCVAVYNEKKNIFLSPMADGPLKFVSNVDDNMNIINISKYGRDFSVVKVPYAFKLLMQELQAMNCQMRVITEDNVDQLMTLTEGDDIKLLGFNNLEEVAEKTKDRNEESKRMRFRGMKESAAIDYEKLMEHTPTPEAIANVESYFQDEKTLYNQPMDDGNIEDFSVQIQTKLDDDGRKSQYRFNPGDIIVFEDDMPQYKYKIIEFDDEDMAYVTQAIEGPFEGKYRNSYEDDIITPPKSPSYSPNNAPAGPTTPDYAFDLPSPKAAPSPSDFKQYNTSTPELQEEPFDTDDEDSMNFDDDNAAPKYIPRPAVTPSPDDDSDNMSYERTPEKKEEVNEDGEKILNRISSMDNNPADSKGLEKLSTIEDNENKEEEEEGESGDKKKIV